MGSAPQFALTPPSTTPDVVSPGLLVGCPLGQYPIGRFGQMSGHRTDRFVMPFGAGQEFIQVTHMATGRAPAYSAACIRSLDKGLI